MSVSLDTVIRTVPSLYLTNLTVHIPFELLCFVLCESCCYLGRKIKLNASKSDSRSRSSSPVSLVWHLLLHFLLFHWLLFHAVFLCKRGYRCHCEQARLLCHLCRLCSPFLHFCLIVFPLHSHGTCDCSSFLLFFSVSSFIALLRVSTRACYSSHALGHINNNSSSCIPFCSHVESCLAMMSWLCSNDEMKMSTISTTLISKKRQKWHCLTVPLAD